MIASLPRAKLWASFAVLGLISCGAAKVSDFSGSWVLTAESRHLISPVGSAPANSVIELRANGQFIASNVPATMAGLSQAFSYVNGSGQWRIVSVDGKAQVYLLFNSIDGEPNAALPYGRPLEISGYPSPKSLYYFVGDPDEHHTIEFAHR